MRYFMVPPPPVYFLYPSDLCFRHCAELRLIESGLSRDLSPFGPPSKVSRAALPGRLGPGDTFELPKVGLRYRAGVRVRPASFLKVLRFLRRARLRLDDLLESELLNSPPEAPEAGEAPRGEVQGETAFLQKIRFVGDDRFRCLAAVEPAKH